MLHKKMMMITIIMIKITNIMIIIIGVAKT